MYHVYSGYMCTTGTGCTHVFIRFMYACSTCTVVVCVPLELGIHMYLLGLCTHVQRLQWVYVYHWNWVYPCIYYVYVSTYHVYSCYMCTTKTGCTHVFIKFMYAYTTCTVAICVPLKLGIHMCLLGLCTHVPRVQWLYVYH